ncbi:hypothetical protein ACHQM5_023043 [Ranunculus cassubicifolius]
MAVGTDEVGLQLSSAYGVKAHHSMCKELMKYVDRITKIFRSIESSQPKCRSGIDALCSISVALEKANLLIQHCTESSKLYLVITGDAIKLRCERVQKTLVQSLSHIQSMVPVVLAAQISAIVEDLINAKFVMGSSDEEAGKVLLHLLHLASKSNSPEDTESEAFRSAAFRLQLTSSKALLIEKRSIKKLLDKVRYKDEAKERILKYLLNLLRKYEHSKGSQRVVNSCSRSEDKDLYQISMVDVPASILSNEAQQDVGLAIKDDQYDSSCKLTPPDEFRCPISLRVMHDPVVIATGQTFERVWIEEWFKEGHDTCPMTQRKLSHLSIVPNSFMKDLISKWCRKHGLSIPDPSPQPIRADTYESRTFSSCSIASFGSSLHGVPIQSDVSSVSFRSDVSSVDMSLDSFASYQSSSQFSHGLDNISHSKLGELPWESQRRVIEYVSDHMNDNEGTCNSILGASFFETLLRFLKDACHQSDVKAQKVGARVLRIILTKSRKEVASFYEDMLYVLISFLDSETIEEALAIFEVLSEDDEYSELEVVASCALPHILKIVESRNMKLQLTALRILCNYSLETNICTEIVRLGYVPMLISLLGVKSLALYCLTILRHLCTTEEGRDAVGENNELIISVLEFLETGSHEEQEDALGILLCLCFNRVEYCRLVLEEGVMPSLISISISGSSKGKEISTELLHLLDDRCNNFQTSFSATESSSELPCETKPVDKAPGYFKRKIRLLSNIRLG